jgi:hypothetical protein
MLKRIEEGGLFPSSKLVISVLTITITTIEEVCCF